MVHDWGGMIGMGWAHRQPERVTKLVLLNTAAFGLPASKRLPASLWLARNTAIGSVLVRGFNAFARGATRMAVTRRPLSREVREGLCAPYDSWANRRAVLRFVQDIPMSSAHPSWNELAATDEALARFADRQSQAERRRRRFAQQIHSVRQVSEE